MGYEISGALGIKMAASERDVYALVGDGSYLMLNQDIVTSIQKGVKITIVLVDNHGFQCIRGLQTSCGGKEFGNEFRFRADESHRLDGDIIPVDFVANAKSLGATVFEAKDEQSLIDALGKASEQVNTTVIYLPVRRESNIPGYSWWDVPMSASSQNPDVQKAR
jgi:3D-(3,5/4)-trihydroxycyclohexane-1,2-dione acylhydrolase (decyclizing)